jgi:hypothetical protein
VFYAPPTEPLTAPLARLAELGLRGAIPRWRSRLVTQYASRGYRATSPLRSFGTLGSAGDLHMDCGGLGPSDDRDETCLDAGGQRVRTRRRSSRKRLRPGLKTLGVSLRNLPVLVVDRGSRGEDDAAAAGRRPALGADRTPDPVPTSAARSGWAAPDR